MQRVRPEGACLAGSGHNNAGCPRRDVGIGGVRQFRLGPRRNGRRHLQGSESSLSAALGDADAETSWDGGSIPPTSTGARSMTGPRTRPLPDAGESSNRLRNGDAPGEFRVRLGGTDQGREGDRTRPDGQVVVLGFVGDLAPTDFR